MGRTKAAAFPYYDTMRVLNIGVGKIGVSESLENLPSEGVDAALIALNEEVDFSSEIRGRSTFSVRAAAVSQRLSYPILIGCKTKYGEIRHLSVMTFSHGELSDIADRTLNLGGGFYEGDKIKVLRLKRFNAGLLVDTDVLLYRNWQKLAPHCSVVFSVGLSGEKAELDFIPRFSEKFGKPYVVVYADGTLLWGNPK